MFNDNAKINISLVSSPQNNNDLEDAARIETFGFVVVSWLKSLIKKKLRFNVSKKNMSDFRLSVNNNEKRERNVNIKISKYNRCGMFFYIFVIFITWKIIIFFTFYIYIVNVSVREILSIYLILYIFSTKLPVEWNNLFWRLCALNRFSSFSIKSKNTNECAKRLMNAKKKQNYVTIRAASLARVNITQREVEVSCNEITSLWHTRYILICSYAFSPTHKCHFFMCKITRCVRTSDVRTIFEKKLCKIVVIKKFLINIPTFLVFELLLLQNTRFYIYIYYCCRTRYLCN